MSKTIKEEGSTSSDIRKLAGVVGIGELADAENLEISDQFTEKEGDEEDEKIKEEIRVLKRRAGITTS